MCLNHSQILNIEMVSMALVKTTKSVDYISKTSISDLNIYKKNVLRFSATRDVNTDNAFVYYYTTLLMTELMRSLI